MKTRIDTGAALAASLLILLASPALAARTMAVAAPVVAAPGLEAQLAQAATLVDANKTAEALAILDPLLAATEAPIERGQIESLRSFALARQNRIPEAHKAIEAAVASAPAPTALLLRQLFLLRAFDGDPPGAADTLQLIAASDPRALKELPTEVVGEVLRAIAKDDNRSFETRYSLVAADWAPDDETLGDLDSMRLRLVGDLARRGRLDDAKPFADRILNPVNLVRLGIDRRFAPLWPAVEARLGPGADIADAAFVAASKARFDAQPNSLVARMGYAEALNIASREPEALKIVDVAKTPAELAALADREVWLVNLHAALLGDAGRIDEALARFSALNASPANGRTSMIGTIINQALFAESVDRAKEALAAADFADSLGATTASDYGKLFIQQARACALTQLGRKADAEAAAAALIARPDANGDAFIVAMICLDRMDAAAAAIVRRLNDPDQRAEMLFNLQPFLIAESGKVREARQRAGLRALKARPEVKAAYLKVGRDLPAAVAPPR